MEIIDAHVHSLECGIMCGGEVDVRLEPVMNGLNEMGISKALFVPINDISWQDIDKMNDYMVDIVKNNKNIIGFIDIDISKVHYYRGIEKLENYIKKYHKLGLKGIKVHLQNLGVNFDDWRLLSVYKTAEELNIPIMVHCYPGAPPGGTDNSNPIYMDKILRVFHKTKFIISHLGGTYYFPQMTLINHDNVYFETSASINILKKYFGIEFIRTVFEDIGYDKIFFGSDYPTEDSLESQIDTMKEIIPEKYYEDVFSKNIIKFGKNYGWWDL